MIHAGDVEVDFDRNFKNSFSVALGNRMISPTRYRIWEIADGWSDLWRNHDSGFVDYAITGELESDRFEGWSFNSTS